MQFWTCQTQVALFHLLTANANDAIYANSCRCMLTWQVIKVINTTIKITSVTVMHEVLVVGVAGWTGDTDRLAGWPVRGDGGHGRPASSRRWAVQVHVCWARWRASVRPWLGGVLAWHKAASPLYMDGSIVFARWRKYAPLPSTSQLASISSVLVPPPAESR